MEYQPPNPPESQTPLPSGKSSTGMEPNLAAALSYLCGWITGLVFYLIEKDNNFVRFHAMQSIIVFGAVTVLSIILQIMDFIPGIRWISWIAGIFLWIAALIAWVILIIKAYQGDRFHFPVAGDIAEKNVR